MEVLSRLKQHGHTIIIIDGREDKKAGSIREYLSRWGVPFDSVQPAPELVISEQAVIFDERAESPWGEVWSELKEIGIVPRSEEEDEAEKIQAAEAQDLEVGALAALRVLREFFNQGKE